MEKITHLPKKLQFWNPLDIGRLLLWVLWFPDCLKTHRQMYGETTEKYLAGWLISTLIWLPFFLMTFAIGFELIPPMPLSKHSHWDYPNYVEYSQFIGIAYFFTAILGFYFARVLVFTIITVEGFFLLANIGVSLNAENFIMVILLIYIFIISSLLIHVINSELSKVINPVIGIVGFLVIFYIISILLFLILWTFGNDFASLINLANKSINTYVTICLIINILSTIVVIDSFSIKSSNKSLETGKFSYFNRFLFILLIANYAFVIWTYYLNGWQYFK